MICSLVIRGQQTIAIKDRVGAGQKTERLHLIVGSKFEYNDYTQWEVQPNVRMVWQPEAGQSVWAAISRGVRTPSRTERDFRVDLAVVPPGTPFNPGPIPVATTFFGMDDFASEEVTAYELGYRIQPRMDLVLDVAFFINDYDDLITSELGAPLCGPSLRPVTTGCLATDTHLVSPIMADNQASAEVAGLELVADWHVNADWRLQLAYSYLDMQLELDASSMDIDRDQEEGESPQQQVSLRSSWNIGSTLQFDAWYRYVDELPSLDVDAYSALDLRLGWQATPDLELSLVAQNLLDNSHSEFRPQFIAPVLTEVERSLYLAVNWAF